jgi:hypothetical protein
MTTRIDSTGPAPLITTAPTAARTTAPPLRPFQSVMNAGAGAVIGGAEAAVQRLPGGAILAAAFRPTGPSALTQPGSVSSVSPIQTTPEGYPTSASGSASVTPGTSTQTGGDPAIEGMLTQNADQNMYYIALQERISAENRTYSAYSNVLRVRHDTMKNAIGNLR